MPVLNNIPPMLEKSGNKKKVKKIIRRPVSFNFAPNEQVQNMKAAPANTNRLVLNISSKLYDKLKELAGAKKVAVESMAKVFIKERIDKEYSDLERHLRKVVAEEAPAE